VVAAHNILPPGAQKTLCRRIHIGEAPLGIKRRKGIRDSLQNVDVGEVELFQWLCPEGYC
jgi:hypothetical protein